MNVTSFAFRSTIWPTALLSLPTTNSPLIAFWLRFNPDTNFNLSKTGAFVSLDSNIATTFTTSGTFKDISSSSTLRPYASLGSSKLLKVEIPTVLVTSTFWLLTKSFVLLVKPNFLRVTFTVAVVFVPLLKPLNVIMFPLFVISTWSDVNGSVVPSG